MAGGAEMPGFAGIIIDSVVWSVVSDPGEAVSAAGKRFAVTG